MLLLLALFHPCGGVQVATHTGVYEGRQEVSYSGTPFYSFLGIKYAHQVRFKASVPVEASWELKNATQAGPACLQTKSGKKLGEEDCLFLNVFSPDLDASLPVIVYIHGGSFMSGVAPTGVDLFMDTQRVVYVTIQYRLGILGFLDFKSRKYPSNLGLKDMVEALKWVRRNVRDFGGDPGKVTLEGESSGSTSVQLLMLSPLAKGLFRSAVSESGCACASWALATPDSARRVLRLLARATKCPHDSLRLGPSAAADDVARCLAALLPDQLVIFSNYLMGHSSVRKVNSGLFRLAKPLEQEVAKKMVVLTKKHFKYKFPHLPFLPVLEPESYDKAFLTRYPWQDTSSNLPWITGVNSYESLNLLPSHDVSEKTLLFMLKYDLIGPTVAYMMMYDDKASSPGEVTRQLEEFYLQGGRLSDENLVRFLRQVINDGMFNFPKYECLSLRKEAPSWSYVFSYLRDPEVRDRVPGVSHAEELNYLFENKTFNVRANGTERDSQVSRTFLNLLVSFAENGVPSSQNVTWDRYDPDSNRVLLIDRDGSFKMASDPSDREEKFWTTLKLRDKLTMTSQ